MNGAPIPYWILLVGAWPIWFVIVWAIWNSLLGRRDTELVEKSLAWPETQGTVTASKVVWGHVEVAYQYHVSGTTNNGKYEISLSPVAPGSLVGSAEFGREAREDIELYPPGAFLIIRYNPENPTESVLYCRAPRGQSDNRRGEPTQPSEPAPAPISFKGNPTKLFIAAACVLVIFLGLLVAGSLETQRVANRQQFNRQLEQNNRNVALERLHNSDPKDIYDRINHDSFGDQLPLDTKVIWADMTPERRCNGCMGMTDWDHGPEIRINTPVVKTGQDLRETMQHEMCHVAVDQWGTDDWRDLHGPAFQECMKRFQ